MPRRLPRGPEAIERAYFGCGYNDVGSFNPFAPYFRVNNRRHLESLDKQDYEDFVKSAVLDELAEAIAEEVYGNPDVRGPEQVADAIDRALDKG